MPVDGKIFVVLSKTSRVRDYFVQEVGAATVTALNARGAKHIDTAVADQALAAFSSIKIAFYDSRVDGPPRIGGSRRALVAVRAGGREP